MFSTYKSFVVNNTKLSKEDGYQEKCNSCADIDKNIGGNLKRRKENSNDKSNRCFSSMR